ncbi:MAG: UDP-N-acetylglucosamine 2-epimerase (hydrolyzing) [Gemmatimonadetes bacterium]|nr:UDP-N-acetylglucosamine 2-epimerase (hydrolyzing) [Gemmatimonadota bacterium]
MRAIGVVTVARSDYGIYLSILRQIARRPGLRLHLFVSGMHLAPEFGLTVRTIEADGFEVADRIEMLVSSDTPEGISKSMGLGTIGFAQAFARSRPDLLCVLGDRFEMHAAAVAALPFRIPVAHIHGGEITEGAIDNALRHSLTRLSHLHFASLPEYARRLLQMGEEPWRITVSGAPSLDNLASVERVGLSELAASLDLPLTRPPLLVTFHPVTLEYDQADAQVAELLHALRAVDAPVVFTLPNADTSGRLVARRIAEFVRSRQDAFLVENLGTGAYFSMMANALAMVGNSSSGIIEAASFRLPVVDIGSRQRGRVKPVNVIECGYPREEIVGAIRRAVSEEFRKRLDALVNPYETGHAAEVIVDRLEAVDLDERLVVKRFIDLPVPVGAPATFDEVA